MPRLDIRGVLEDRQGWHRAGAPAPGFDVAAMRARTLDEPVWPHFGAGNIFRAFIADIQHELLEKGEAKSGVIAAETFDFELIDRVFAANDSMTLRVHLRPDGTTARKIVAGVGRALRADTQCEALEQRRPNPFLPDTPARIATDTSLKLPIRFGETIKAYARDARLSAGGLVGIPLAIAGWSRYPLGVDDAMEPMQVSPDPMAGVLRGWLDGVEPGRSESAGGKLRPILSNEELFGVDLYGVGLGGKVEEMFSAMLAGKGAVRRTLGRYLNI